MKLVSGIVDSGFFAQSALSAEVATKDSIGRNISETYLTGVDLTPYQTIEGMTAYQSAGDYYSASNPSGFLVANDITGKLDTSVYAADSANFLTAIPAGTMNESAFGYDANDKISGYNGSAFAGGSDVPEGVMVESGLEYNAVNEISAYNGSAIAQYGAEKQFLVHDDTLCHLSNSAQFALGVNLSAVAQLLGVDETVLWEGNMPMTSGSTARCSESIYNFNKIKFLYNASADNEYQQNSNYTVETDQTSASNRISWGDGFTIGNNWYNRYFNRFTIANGTDLTLTNATCYWGQTAQGGYSLTGHPGSFYKIIGIGRKA